MQKDKGNQFYYEEKFLMINSQGLHVKAICCCENMLLVTAVKKKASITWYYSV